MVGWKLKAAILTAVAVLVLPIFFHRRSKCDMISVLNQIVSKYKIFISTSFAPWHQYLAIHE